MTTEWSGVVGDDDIIKYQEELWAVSDTTGFDAIVNAQEVTSVKVTQEVIHRLSREGVEYDKGAQARTAIIAKSDVEFGLSRMYGLIRDGLSSNARSVRVFRNSDDAVAWLDEDPEEEFGL